VALSLSSTVTCAADATHREIANEAVVLNLASGTYFGLNEVATRAWGLLKAGASLADVHSALLAEYEVDAETLTRDLLAWAERLLHQGLIVSEP
jgi:hypothetical protein